MSSAASGGPPWWMVVEGYAMTPGTSPLPSPPSAVCPLSSPATPPPSTPGLGTIAVANVDGASCTVIRSGWTSAGRDTVMFRDGGSTTSLTRSPSGPGVSTSTGVSSITAPTIEKPPASSTTTAGASVVRRTSAVASARPPSPSPVASGCVSPGRMPSTSSSVPSALSTTSIVSAFVSASAGVGAGRRCRAGRRPQRCRPRRPDAVERSLRAPT